MDKQAKYHLRFSINQIVNILYGFGFLFLCGFTLYAGLKRGMDSFIVVLSTSFFVFGIYPFIVSASHLVYSLNKQIEIYFEKDKILLRNRFRSQSEKISSIKAVEIHEVDIDFPLFPYSYAYAKYYLDNGKIFILTDFLAKSFFIPKKIKPAIINSILPLINTKNKIPSEPISETEMLMKEYKELTDKELGDIIDSGSKYRKSAKKAAKTSLKKEKRHTV